MVGVHDACLASGKRKAGEQSTASGQKATQRGEPPAANLITFQVQAIGTEQRS